MLLRPTSSTNARNGPSSSVRLAVTVSSFTEAKSRLTSRSRCVIEVSSMMWDPGVVERNSRKLARTTFAVMGRYLFTPEICYAFKQRVLLGSGIAKLRERFLQTGTETQVFLA